MNGSIDLETESYCYGCESFEPECRKDIMYGDEGPCEVAVTVSCKRLECCRRIAARIVPPGQKNEKTPRGL